MYALKIEVDGGDASQKRPAVSTEVPNKEREQSENVDSVPVSVGNPRVEHINGLVHLYRESHGGDEAGTSVQSLPVTSLASCITVKKELFSCGPRRLQY